MDFRKSSPILAESAALGQSSIFLRLPTHFKSKYARAGDSYGERVIAVAESMDEVKRLPWCKEHGEELIERLLKARSGKGYAMKLTLDRIPACDPAPRGERLVRFKNKYACARLWLQRELM